MRSRIFSASFVSFIVALALVISGACTGKGNPIGPDPPLPPTPPNAIVHSVSVSGSNRPFRWWIQSLDPPKESQLTVGQSFSTWITCDGPSGFSYALRQEFSNGPGTEFIRMIIKQHKGPMSGCARSNILGLTGSLGAGYPDLPYYRFSVWVQEGDDWSSISPNSRPPDLVIDEYIGWTINRG